MRSRFSKLQSLALAAALFAAPGCRSKEAPKESGDAAHGGEAEGEHADEKGVIRLTPEQAAAANIQTAKAERKAEAGFLEATAEIQAPPDRQARVGSQVSGRIVTVRVKPGARVKVGTALVVVDSPDVGRGKADYLAALAGSRVADETAERERALHAKKITSEREWRQAESDAVKARAELAAAENRLHALGVPHSDRERIKAESHYSSTMSVVSPINGVVVDVLASTGQTVEPNGTLVTIMDLREVVVAIDIYDRDLAQVEVGQKVRARVEAYPDREFTGHVDSIGSQVEEKTRSVKVRVSLPNPDAALKPGMFATVTLEGTTGETRDRLVIPAAALQREGDEFLVFVPKADEPGEYEPRKVKIARQHGEWAEIASGLAEGDVVVTTGSFLLKSEMQKAELGGHGH